LESYNAISSFKENAATQKNIKKILRRVPLFFSRKKGILEYLFLNINLSSLLLSLPAFELMTWLVAVEHIPAGHK
jgi:hypothetical protein